MVKRRPGRYSSTAGVGLQTIAPAPPTSAAKFIWLRWIICCTAASVRRSPCTASETTGEPPIRLPLPRTRPRRLAMISLAHSAVIAAPSLAVGEEQSLANVSIDVNARPSAGRTVAALGVLPRPKMSLLMSRRFLVDERAMGAADAGQQALQRGNVGGAVERHAELHHAEQR